MDPKALPPEKTKWRKKPREVLIEEKPPPAPNPFVEGHVITIAGQTFLVSAVRRHRIVLTPVSVRPRA